MTHQPITEFAPVPGPFQPNPFFEAIKDHIEHNLENLPEGAQNAIDAWENLPPSGLSDLLKGPAGTLIKMWEVGIYAYITYELGKDVPATIADKIPWEPVEPAEPEILHFDNFFVSESSSNTINHLMQEGDTLHFDWMFDAGDYDYIPSDDFAYFSVVEADHYHYQMLSSVSQVGDYVWHEVTYTAETEGLHTFEWGVKDISDDLLLSTLYVENIYIVQA